MEYIPSDPTTYQPAAESVVAISDPLTLNLKDEDLVEVIDKRIRDSVRFYEGLNIPGRRLTNEKYLFGRQINEDKLNKRYEEPYIDNMIYEQEAAIKPLAMSRMPDFIIKPGSDKAESVETADVLSKVVTDAVKTRMIRNAIAMSFKHHPTQFIGVIKALWNPERQDYEFVSIHPENIVIDHTAPSADASKMKFIAHYYPLSIKDIIIRFNPDKKKLQEAVNQVSGVRFGEGDYGKESKMATTIKICEVWFTWYQEVDGKWERIEAVAWKLGDLILGKMRNPNWDREGEVKLFTYGDPNDPASKHEATVEETQQAAVETMLGMAPSMPMVPEKIFRNYFENEEKPFIFLVSEQFGKMPLDETSRIEQNLYLQMNLDSRGKQMKEMLDRARGKHIFSKRGGLTSADIQKLDMSNPYQDILIDGDVRETHGFIQPELPSQALYSDYENTRTRMKAKAGVSAVTGEIQSDVATSNQIAREANFTQADDLVDATINTACEKIAQWILHFIKLRYTEEHLTKLLGEDGTTVFVRLNRDMIEDGIEVTISASGTDKLKNEKRAFDMAAAQMIDPYHFYKDIGASDPKGRTEALMLYFNAPELYMQKFVNGLSNTGEMVDSLNGQGAALATQAIMQIQQGVMPAPPTQVDEGYIQTIDAFLNSPEFAQSSPQVQQIAAEFASLVMQAAQSQPQPTQGQAPAAPAAPAAGPAQRSNPNPASGSVVVATPPTNAPAGSPRNL